MIYLLLEDPRGMERLERIAAALGDASLRESNTTRLDGQRATPGEVRNACLAFPFLSPRRLVIVRGLLARFSPRDRAPGSRPPARKSAARAGKAASKAKETEQEFIALLRDVPEHTDLVLLEVSPWRPQELLSALREVGAEILQPLRPEDLPGWIRQRVEAKGGHISGQVVGQLAGIVGDDLQSLERELDKLVTHAGDQPVTWPDIQSLVHSAREASIFTLVDRMAEGNASAALKELHRLLADGAAAGGLLPMVSRQFRLLLLWKELRSAGSSEREAAGHLRLHGFVAEKVARQSGRYSMAELEEVYARLVNIDLNWKTGRGEPLPALELLIAELGTRQRRPAPARTV